MKLYLKAVVKDSKLDWPSWDYISYYKECGIKCKVLGKDLGTVKDKYKLCLEGSRENIESFISYLRMESFKVEVF